MIERILDLQLPQGQSAFLWGPRKTGKSTYLKTHFSESIWYDFLNTEIFFALSARPALLREQLAAQPGEKLKLPVILDEVQKIPTILDEVHWLIENKGLGFILCGSSARKLKRAHANMLGGRAWRYELFPLTYPELEQADLLKILNHGLLPQHYLAAEQAASRFLNAYLRDYMKEEIFDEGLTRNIPAFTRFFEMLPFSHGELINYSKIATDCGVDSKTVKGYFEILVDTLLGDFLLPYQKRIGRDIISRTPKFYLFDVGVAGALSHRKLTTTSGEEFGKALEHYILMELRAYFGYKEIGGNIAYWRTKTGLEVDFILDHGKIAIEVKGSTMVRKPDIKGLLAFSEEHAPQRSIVVCNEALPRKVGQVEFMPWKHFLEQLWEGRIVG